MKRVVIIHQDSIHSYSVERRQHKDSADDKKPTSKGLSTVKNIDRTVPTLRETVKSRARFASREATLNYNPTFRASCSHADVRDTPRQARKWNMRKGKAYAEFQKERESHVQR